MFVLEGRQTGAALAASVRRVLEEGALPPRTLEIGPGGITATLPLAGHAAALRLIHSALVRPLPVVSLAIAGPNGRVGRALCSELRRHAGAIANRLGVELRLVAAFGRSRALFAPEGLSFDDEALSLQGAPATRWEEVVDLLLSHGPRPLILVDATASDELASAYARLLEGGIGVVTPNKRANARALHEYRRLKRLSASGVPYLYGTTVGAGLPVLRNIRDLTNGGDRIRSIRAVLSGTLSFVLGKIHEGSAFGEAVDEARRLGLTEPDPKEDLSGMDVARKLLVILRETGLALEPADLEVLPLDASEGADGRWAALADSARQCDGRLVHVASWNGDRARVGVEIVPRGDALARIRPGENVVVIETSRYALVPLTLAGPGAGPEVTAGNLLSEVVLAAEALRPTAEERASPRARTA